MPSTIIEPFRIKTVEPIRQTTAAERQSLLASAGYNLFSLPADAVLIDLLTDSGTGAMSAAQWSAIMSGDESYAGAKSFQRFEAVVQELTGFHEVIPTHQGRAAEHLLFKMTVSPGHAVVSNTLFDTTRANTEMMGGIGIDLPTESAADLQSEEGFKGNMNLDALEERLSSDEVTTLVMMTITNNSVAGQPVSLDNMHAVSKICRQHKVPLYIDAARFAENAYLSRSRDPALEGMSLPDIARAYFDLADGCTMSAKKGGMANIGGFLALRDPELAARARQALVVTEGFPTYGGLAGRDLDAIAVGLREALDESYQHYRHASIKYLTDRLLAKGIPHVRPAGGHAVYLDSNRFLDHLSPEDLPGQALAVALYLHGGIRSCEIGSVMFGQFAGTQLIQAAEHGLVRLAFPRRVYTQSHVDYLAEVIEEVYADRKSIPGIEIESCPEHLRHFSATFSPKK
ncbi:MAG: tryptophanase [Kofleriaceae bacterium]|nr:tryptophanase [Kofleriaceae bacterium]